MTSPPATADQIKARLAYELAAQLMPSKDVFRRFGIDRQQAKAILASPQFRTLYQEAKVVWNSSDGTKERIRAKAGMMVEDSLLELYRLFHDSDIAPPSRLDAFKQIVQIANLGPPRAGENGAEAGPKFSLTINIPPSPGHAARSVTIDAPAEIDSGADDGV